jgi:hypothetical protein
LKRLAVTLVEDAWVNDTCLHDLLLMACIATNDPDWFPTQSHLAMIFETAQSALVGGKAVVYNSSSERSARPLVFKGGLTLLKKASCMLDLLKSFPWDLTMLRDVAVNPSLSFQTASSSMRPKEMENSHHLDHHVGPEFAYYLEPAALVHARNRYKPSERFGDLNQSQSQPYAVLFREVFQWSSGFNYRRTPDRLVEMQTKDEFVAMIRRAQDVYFLAKHGKYLGLDAQEVKDMHDESSSMVVVEMDLDPMWLAGCVGHIPITHDRVHYYAFMREMHPKVIIDVVRCPARKQHNIEIDKVARLQVIKKAESLLKSGNVKLQIAAPNLDAGTRVILRHDKLFVIVEESENKKEFKWQEPNLTTSSKISASHLEQMTKLFYNASLETLTRLTQLSVKGLKSMIEFPKIARDGGVEDSPISIHDVAVFQLCLKLQPVLSLQSTRSFQVCDPVVWWHLCNIVVKNRITILCGLASPKEQEEVGWSLHADSKKRTHSATQKQAISSLECRSQDSNFLIMDAGGGKTLVFAEYLLALQQAKMLPRDVIFTTPSCAIEGVERELRCYTDHVQVIDMRGRKRSGRQPIIQPGISLIRHDHVRLASGLFDLILPNALVGIDEFHECLAQKTQRTGCVTRLAAGAKFFFALSGTPTLNHDLLDLCPLLSQIVPFPLNVNNFFVGFSFAVSQRDCVPIKVIRKHVDCDMPASCTDYFKLLPKSLGGENHKPLQGTDLNVLLQLSQDQADLSMATMTVEQVNKGNTVFLVASKARHVQKLLDMLLARGMEREDIYCVFKNSDAITLTDDAIKTEIALRNRSSLCRYYKVVIGSHRVDTGYSMQICNVQISTIYTSNSASRQQIEKRIHRLGSSHKQVCYFRFVVGRIQQLIEYRQELGDAFASILKDFNKMITS